MILLVLLGWFSGFWVVIVLLFFGDGLWVLGLVFVVLLFGFGCADWFVLFGGCFVVVVLLCGLVCDLGIGVL